MNLEVAYVIVVKLKSAGATVSSNEFASYPTNYEIASFLKNVNTRQQVDYTTIEERYRLPIVVH